MKKRSPSPSVPSRSRTVRQPAGGNVLDDIHKKILASTALNGGFDTLLHKIDKIEQGQGQLVSKVDKIHDAIYDPNDGIFAKLSEHKLESTNKINEVQQELTTVSLWKEHKEKLDDKEDQKDDESREKIQKLEQTVDSLSKSKNAAWSVVKWLGVALGGGVVTMLFELIQTKFK